MRAAFSWAFPAIVVATAALAQQPTMRVRGTIEQSDGSTLVVKSRAGDTLTIKLADNVRVSGLIRISIAAQPFCPALQ